jgi:hypothetical protein
MGSNEKEAASSRHWSFTVSLFIVVHCSLNSRFFFCLQALLHARYT